MRTLTFKGLISVGKPETTTFVAISRELASTVGLTTLPLFLPLLLFAFFRAAAAIAAAAALPS